VPLIIHVTSRQEVLTLKHARIVYSCYLRFATLFQTSQNDLIHLILMTYTINIINLLVFIPLGHRPSFIRRTGRYTTRAQCGLVDANDSKSNREQNGLTCLLKYGGVRDNNFLATHPMSDQGCLAFAIARREH
jgi:hypothetical protein